MGSIESNHKAVEMARHPDEVCIKIEGLPGEAPKMVGRHFEDKDLLVSKVGTATPPSFGSPVKVACVCLSCWVRGKNASTCSWGGVSDTRATAACGPRCFSGI